MSSTLARAIDWLERRVKPAVKATYRRPAIEASRAWRRMLPRTCVIGISGSAGKTTTKELLHAALAGLGHTVKSSDSNNQLYDVARSLLSSAPWARFCVQEVGATIPGRFEPMLALLKPQVGVVTNVGTDHLEAFRTQAAVAVEKSKLISSPPADGIAVLNADDPLVAGMALHCRARVVTYGLHSDAQCRAEPVTDRWPNRLALRIHHDGNAVLAQTRLLAGYQATNVLAAVATACSLGVPLEQAAQAVSRHEPMLGRMSVYTAVRGTTVIRDDWKAPDWSILKAVRYVAESHAARKVIVIGTISDSGGRRHLYRDAVAAAVAVADHVLLKGSNNADHLARLALSLDQDVRCWRSHCPRRVICDRCSLIGASAAP